MKESIITGFIQKVYKACQGPQPGDRPDPPLPIELTADWRRLPRDEYKMVLPMDEFGNPLPLPHQVRAQEALKRSIARETAHIEQAPVAGHSRQRDTEIERQLKLDLARETSRSR